jgi:sugar/nucleoside kinase (ribokinase family)
MATSKRAKKKASSKKAKPKFDLLCVGDSCVDIFAFPKQTKIRCQLHNGKDCELCVAYAGKIPAEGFTISFGGNAANVAVGASRLGVKTAIYTHLGDDLFGKAILENFGKEKVNTSLVKVDKGKRSNASMILSAKGERTIISFHEGRGYNLPPTSAEWVYCSSLASGHEKLHRQVRDLTLKEGAKIILNPGSYQIRKGLKKLAPLIEACEVLIVNRNEATRLLGVDCALKGERECLQRLRNLGPRFTLVTDGPNGSYGYGDGEFVFQDVYPLDVVERTGAGDAFSTGVVAAFVSGKGLKEALRWGTVNAAFAVQEIGAQAGLLRKTNLAKALKDWK